MEKKVPRKVRKCSNQEVTQLRGHLLFQRTVQLFRPTNNQQPLALRLLPASRAARKPFLRQTRHFYSTVRNIFMLTTTHPPGKNSATLHQQHRCGTKHRIRSDNGKSPHRSKSSESPYYCNTVAELTSAPCGSSNNQYTTKHITATHDGSSDHCNSMENVYL